MKEELNALSELVIGAAIRVHRELGPGLLESAYEAYLEYELLDRGLRVERQKDLPIVYRGVRVECGFRLDLVVNDLLIIELKAVERLDRIHESPSPYLPPTDRPFPRPTHQLQRGPTG